MLVVSVTPSAAPAAPQPVPAAQRRRRLWHALVTVACGPALAGYVAAVAVLALVVWVAAGAELTADGTAGAAGAAWLAVHQVPLVLHGAPLGVLPLLPTLALGALIARVAARATRLAGLDTPRDAAPLVAAVATAHALVGVAIAGTISGTATPVVTASAGQAALGCGLVAAVAAACGVAGPCGWVRAALQGAPRWASRAVAGTAVGVAALLAGGLGAVLAGLVASPSATRAAFGGWGTDWGTGLGLVLLSIAYLPNAAIAAASWLAGPGLSVGAVSVAPMGAAPGPVPAVPLLVALPEGPAEPWWALALLVPVLAGAAVGRRCASATDHRDGVAAAAAAVAGVVLAFFVLAVLAGGRLGGGVFDPVQVPAGSLAVALAVLLFPPALAVAWLTGVRTVDQPPEAPVEDAPEPDPDESANDEPVERVESEIRAPAGPLC